MSCTITSTWKSWVSNTSCFIIRQIAQRTSRLLSWTTMVNQNGKASMSSYRFIWRTLSRRWSSYRTRTSVYQRCFEWHRCWRLGCVDRKRSTNFSTRLSNQEWKIPQISTRSMPSWNLEKDASQKSSSARDCPTKGSLHLSGCITQAGKRLSRRLCKNAPSTEC